VELHLWVELHLCILKIEGRKVKNIDLAQENGFALCIFAKFVEVGKRCNKIMHMLEKSVINMIFLVCC
jgi:hypothetical protein